jgi:hypothetical protein
VSTALRHLIKLASHPRPAGGDGVAGARSYCADILQAAGFQTAEQAFEYSAFSGAWAMPIAGASAAASAILLYLGRQMPWLIAIATTMLALTVGVLVWLGAGGVLAFPLMRRRGVNLRAARHDGEPVVWLVAHLDSKWQPVSMILRVVGVIGTSVGVIALFALRVAPAGPSDAAAAVALAVTWLCSIPLMLSIVDARNTGAVDNASGASAVLAAAELLPRDANVGVLITDAEELALAGARAWARSRPPGVALNCDSIDDAGQLTAMYSGRRPEALVSRLVAAAQMQSEPIRVMRLIPGILTDSVALADAGWQTLTLSRGNLRTLQRIHTSRDTLDHLHGSGLQVAAQLLADTARTLS